MGIEIREALSARDRAAVYRFRYDVYVTEMNRVQEYADHGTRTIAEPFDEHGNLFAAFSGDTVIGTIRVNYASRGAGYYRALYEMDAFAPYFPDRTCFTTKLMVSAAHRSSTLGLRLCKAGYVKAIRDGMVFDFMDCNAPLVPFFQRMGYRQLVPDIVHHEYGRVHPMVCALHDLGYLREVGSAFASVAAAAPMGLDAAAIDFFYRHIVAKRVDAPGLSADQRRHLLAGVSRGPVLVHDRHPSVRSQGSEFRVFGSPEADRCGN